MRGTRPPAAPRPLEARWVRAPSRGAGEVRVLERRGLAPASASASASAPAAAPPTLVLFHGAGLSARSFETMAAALPDDVSVVAVDARGHGGTTLQPETDFALPTLVADAAAVFDALALRGDVVLAGHSLGGVVATHLAAQLARDPERKAALRGLVVIDAVEGVALASVEAGKRMIAARPASFASLEAAVAWSLTSGPLRGHVSASVSVPDQLVLEEEEAGGGTGGEEAAPPRSDAPAERRRRWRWRTDLAATVPFWEGWFRGLSELFLAVPCPKLLVLAGLEALDPPLIAGHMQGKYQLLVMASVQVGHFVHEDAPGQTAAAVMDFVRRHAAAPRAQRGGMSAAEVIAYSKQLRAQQQRDAADAAHAAGSGSASVAAAAPWAASPPRNVQ